MKGVKVTINPTSEYHRPYGNTYEAKGFYVQGKNIIVVGDLKSGNTIRIKYPLKDVTIEIIY
jgi:hypothetical protein